PLDLGVIAPNLKSGGCLLFGFPGGNTGLFGPGEDGERGDPPPLGEPDGVGEPPPDGEGGERGEPLPEGEPLLDGKPPRLEEPNLDGIPEPDGDLMGLTDFVELEKTDEDGEERLEDDFRLEDKDDLILLKSPELDKPDDETIDGDLTTDFFADDNPD